MAKLVYSVSEHALPNKHASRSKTGFFDLQNFAINRLQSLMHDKAYRCSPLCVVPIHAYVKGTVPQ
jgi:hypothetical protein